MNSKGIFNEFVDVILLIIGIAIFVLFIGTMLYNGKAGVIKTTGVLVYRTTMMEDFVLDERYAAGQGAKNIAQADISKTLDFIARNGYKEDSAEDPFFTQDQKRGLER